MSRKMKESGVEWLGAVPEGWKISSIKRHYQIILGKMLCSERGGDCDSLEKYFCAANVHFDGGADASNLKEMWFSPEEKKTYKVNDGDLLVVEGGAGAGGAAVVKSLLFDAYVQNSILIVRGRDRFANAYAGYLLEFLVKSGYVDYVSNKATIPHFTKEKVGGVPLPVPPLPEQRAIAAYLDERCAKIDAMVSDAKKLIEEYKAWKASLIFEAVTGKIMISGQGSVDGRAVAPRPPRSARGADPTELAIPSMANNVVNRPMRDSGVEWIGQVPEGWGVCRVKYVALIENGQGYISQTTLPGMTQTNYNNMYIPLPSPDEQRAIAAYLDRKCAAIDRVVAEKEGLIADLEQYKKSLIFECVTGKREVA